MVSKLVVAVIRHSVEAREEICVESFLFRRKSGLDQEDICQRPSHVEYSIGGE